MAHSSILTLTMNPTIDNSCSVDRVVPDRKLRCSAPSFEPGGGGINVARAVRQLGGEATALWTCGGAFGHLLRQLLDDLGLPHRPLPIQEMTRESLIVYEEASGEQYRFGMPGPTLRKEEVQACLEQFLAFEPAPEFVVLSGSLPEGVSEDFYAQIVRQADWPARFVVDTSGQALEAVLEVGVELIKPNLQELGKLMGRELENDEEIESAARQLVTEEKTRAVVVSMGSAGAYLVTADGCEYIRSPMAPIRSKVGAGDSMVAGIVLSLARGKSLHDAARFGVAAGAAAVMTPGTTLCRREDTERLHRRMR